MMNKTQFHSTPVKTFFLVFMPTFLLFFAALSPGLSQAVFKSPNFDSYEIKASPGAKLAFTLNDLPDPKVYGDAKGNLEVQINWSLSDQCGNAGIQRSERVKIKSTTHKFITDYPLSKQDNRKKLRLNVSYVTPTKDEDSPAKGYIPASKECATLSVH